MLLVELEQQNCSSHLFLCVYECRVVVSHWRTWFLDIRKIRILLCLFTSNSHIIMLCLFACVIVLPNAFLLWVFSAFKCNDRAICFILFHVTFYFTQLSFQSVWLPGKEGVLMFSQEYQDGETGVEVFSASGTDKRNCFKFICCLYLWLRLLHPTWAWRTIRQEPRAAVEGVLLCAPRIRQNRWLTNSGSSSHLCTHFTHHTQLCQNFSLYTHIPLFFCPAPLFATAQ